MNQEAMHLAVTRQELETLLSESAFIRQYNFALHSIADGTCSLDVPFQPVFDRPGGVVSGQVFMAAADVAIWLAIKTRLGLSDQSLTAEMKTNFLNAARQEPFRCTATILKLGKRLIYGVAECANSRGTLLTHHTVTYMRM